MGARAPETLDASVRVRLSHSELGRYATVFEDVGRFAGLEVAGQLEQLLA